jgi:hypothetical protein
MVVGGLAAVGVLIGLLTFFYWRHTRPLRYMTALDALADVEQKVPKDATDVPTTEQPVVTPAGAAAAAVGATTAVRILDAEESSSTPNGADTKPNVEPDEAVKSDDAVKSNDAVKSDVEPDKAVKSDDTVKPDAEPVVLDEPTKITTVEDLRTRNAFEGD